MVFDYINTDEAPQAVGPYSQAVLAGELIFVSGQLPIDPATGQFAGDDAATQAAQCLKNLLAILAEGGLKAADMVKVTVYLKDMNDFTSVNEVYATFFSDNYPARVCVEVSRLPKDALVEIDCIATK
jgi:2-iminobutanoate/2-iminopropanoate deaminase